MTKLLLILLGLIAWRDDAAGASYYISPSGSDSNGCTASLPCATFPRCAAVMAAGDTCYAVDGTYTTTGTNGWNFTAPGGSAGSPKKFTSVSGLASQVIIQPSDPTTTNVMYFSCASGNARYLELYGLTIHGRGETNGDCTGLSWHNNIFTCQNAGTGGGNNGSIVIQGSSTTMTSGLQIRENLFLMDDSCPAIGQDPVTLLNPARVSFIIMFNANGPLIEKNDFVNASSARSIWGTLYLKRGVKDATIRYNYFEGTANDLNGAVWMMDCDGDTTPNQFGDRSSLGGSARCNNKAYQNIFNGGHEAAVNFKGVTETQEWAYNNTLYNMKTRGIGTDLDAGAIASGDDHQIFNNIFYTSSGNYSDGYVAIPWYGTDPYPCVGDQLYLDNNMYYADTRNFKDCGGGSYTGLTAWKSHLASAYPSNPTVRETNSRAVDPLFVNPAAGDFRLQAGSPARTGGRGVGYPGYLGAIDPVNGTTIGCTFDPSCYGYTAPSVHPRTKVR